MTQLQNGVIKLWISQSLLGNLLAHITERPLRFSRVAGQGSHDVISAYLFFFFFFTTDGNMAGCFLLYLIHFQSIHDAFKQLQGIQQLNTKSGGKDSSLLGVQI